MLKTYNYLKQKKWKQNKKKKLIFLELQPLSLELNPKSRAWYDLTENTAVSIFLHNWTIKTNCHIAVKFQMVDYFSSGYKHVSELEYYIKAEQYFLESTAIFYWIFILEYLFRLWMQIFIPRNSITLSFTLISKCLIWGFCLQNLYFCNHFQKYTNNYLNFLYKMPFINQSIC